MKPVGHKRPTKSNVDACKANGVEAPYESLETRTKKCSSNEA